MDDVTFGLKARLFLNQPPIGDTHANLYVLYHGVYIRGMVAVQAIGE